MGLHMLAASCRQALINAVGEPDVGSAELLNGAETIGAHQAGEDLQCEGQSDVRSLWWARCYW